MSPRRIKEASVAGESPDKSEQRKSSGTTPEEHDPRIAVFREPVASGGSGSGSATGGRAGGVTDTPSDTATAVFGSPLRPEDSDDSDGPDEPEEPVASAEAEAPGSGASDSDAAADTPEAGSGPQDAQDVREGAGVPGGPGEAADGPEEAAAPRDGHAPSGEAPEAAEAPGAAEAGAADESSSEPGDSRLRAAVAAWVATGDEHDADDRSADDRDPEGKAPEDQDPEDRAVAAADAVEETTAADEGGAETDTPGAPAAGSASGTPRVPRTREEATTRETEPVASDEAASEESEPEPAEVAAGTESARDRRGIDQPTAVFKAVRPDRVDQPTTALKLPPKPKPQPQRATEPETPAERTSKFVPLRSDDIRPASTVGPTITPSITPAAPERGPEPGPNARPTGSAGPGNAGNGFGGLPEAERTRQQPLPPKPPLDLLAELTNTPPPRQTPVRTAVRRVKIWTPLLLLVVIIFAVAQAVRPLPAPSLVLSAAPTYTFSGGKLDMPWPAEGQGAVEVEGVGTIGTYGKEKSAPIASVAKVMTAYVILKEHPITGKQTGAQIEVDKLAGEEANRPDESTAPIKEGQKYTERQMLQLLMIPSGNNVARLLARWDATTEKAFVEKMNAAAEDLGMTNSTYTDPSGLKSSTVSTPADQLKLAKAVMQNDVFREIVNMPQAKIPGIDNMIYNNNSILLEPGVSGIKTGSSTPAGGNLVWAADTIIDGKSRRILGVVMGADLDGTLNEKLDRAKENSLKLIQAAQKGVDSATVVKKGQIVGYVDDGLGGRTPVVSTKDLKAVGWGGLEVDLDLTAVEQELAHAAKPGTVVGAVTVGTGTGKVSAPVALQSEMTEPTFGEKLTRIG